jgi:hypothetical protein
MEAVKATGDPHAERLVVNLRMRPESVENSFVRLRLVGCSDLFERETCEFWNLRRHDGCFEEMR